MKKAFKIIGIILLMVVFLLALIPFAFQSQIKDMVKRFINENLNAKVEFSDVNLSFLRSFPQAHVRVDDLIVTNFKPFEDETFATAKSISFTMSVKELFKKADEEPIVVNSIHIDEVLLTLKTDTFGNNNYDITKEKENTSTDRDDHFSFDIEDYQIDNSALTYLDEKSKTFIYITELNHIGKGIFSADQSELDTKSEAHVSINIDSTAYLSNNPVKLEAIIGLDLKNNKYAFKENKGFINQLPLEFKGYVQLLGNGQDIDITFENPESSFKDFLAVFPEVYSKNINDVETSGDFKVNGEIKGLISEETIPQFNISIRSNNASFKYPNLPKRVENISIDATVKNTTGQSDDTYIDLKTFNFKIDNDVFKSSATLKDLTKNMLVNADIDGTLNLANISKAYPIVLEKELSGILKAKVNTIFDMNAIETNDYDRIKNKGLISVADFVFSSEDFENPIRISKANMTFNPGTVSLNNFNGKTGESDLDATGTIKNLLGFLIKGNKLQGQFNVNSKNFVVSDFLVSDESKQDDSQNTTKKEVLRIPNFLECSLNAKAKNVVYNNLKLENVNASLFIKDQQATLSEMTSSLFDGNLVLSGNVSTQSQIPTFNLNFGAESFDISKSFKALELFQNIAPIAKLLQGKLNSKIAIKGNLYDGFSPDLSTVSGNAFAQLLSAALSTENNEILDRLKSNLNFIDFNKLNLKDVIANLNFENGNVNVKPFNLKYQDIDIVVSGGHSFDKKMNYSVLFNVPAKYLGSDVNRLIGKINDKEVNTISIPVTANITGSFSNPNVSTDLSGGISNLTKQLIEIEKQKLLNSGKDKIKELLGGLNTPKEIPNKDSTSTQTNPIKVDTTANPSKEIVKEGIKDVLGGLIKTRKKKDTVN